MITVTSSGSFYWPQNGRKFAAIFKGCRVNIPKWPNYKNYGKEVDVLGKDGTSIFVLRADVLDMAFLPDRRRKETF